MKLARREKRGGGQYKFFIKKYYKWVSEYPDSSKSRYDDDD